MANNDNSITISKEIIDTNDLKQYQHVQHADKLNANKHFHYHLHHDRNHVNYHYYFHHYETINDNGIYFKEDYNDDYQVDNGVFVFARRS